MHEELRRRLLLKLAEEVEGDKSQEYLNSRLGKVPVNPPSSPGDDGGSSQYPIDSLEESAGSSCACGKKRCECGVSKEAMLNILRNQMYKQAEEDMEDSDECSDCGESPCECADESMEKESAWRLRRTALDLIKQAMPGAMPEGPPQEGPPPAPPQAGPPPMPPQAPPMPPQAPQPGPEMGGDPQMNPMLMQALQKHLMEHQMMEQMGMMGGEEMMEGGLPEEDPGPPPSAGEEEIPESGPPPEGEVPKEAAVRILKDLIYGN